MATPAERVEALVPAERVAALLGIPSSGGALDACREAAYAYVTRYHAVPDDGEDGKAGTWRADYVMGAVKLAAALQRDKNRPGVAEAFSQGNVFKRATDVEIEQLLQIGRYELPSIG